jgi:hypothetical protein
MTNQNTALATVTQSAPIEPRDMKELQALAKDAAESRFYGAASQQQALMLLMAGRDLGLSYAQSLRAFHVIEGRLALSADAMVAVCLGRRDICNFFRVLESSSESCTVETQREGDPPRRYTFTMADAERAELVKLTGNGKKSNWHKYPGRMLLARAKSFLAREVYPDILLGMVTDEEAKEIATNDQHIAPVVRQVPAARPSPAHDADGVLTEDPRVVTMLARIDRAATLRDTQAIGAEVKATKGEYTADQLETMRQALAKQVADLKAIDAERARQPEIIDAEPISPAPPAVEAAQ